MADDITLNAGSGGVDLATDDISSVHYQRVKLTLGANGSADGDLALGQPMPLLDEFAIARGAQSTYAHKRILGRNDAIGTTAEDLWTPGGTLTVPTTAQTFTIESSSANDTNSSGSGARTVKLYGSSGGTPANETIALNGTTPVDSVGTYDWLDRIEVVTAGSTGSNAGTLTVKAKTDTNTQGGAIIGRNRSENAFYEVPTGKAAYVLEWSGSIGRALTTGYADITMSAKTSSGLWMPVLPSRGVSGSGFVERLAAPVKLAAGTRLKLSAIAAAASTQVFGGLELVEVG